jgi:hypothetical protein
MQPRLLMSAIGLGFASLYLSSAGADGGGPAGGNVLHVADKSYTLAYSYAFMSPTVDFAHSPDPMHPKMVDVPAVALSDQPLDAKVLQAAGRGVLEELDRVTKKGALLIATAHAEADGAADIMLRLPGWDTAKTGDLAAEQKLTLDRSKPGQLSGRLVLVADPKTHAIDPVNFPLIACDVAFQTAAPQPLPPVGK